MLRVDIEKRLGEFTLQAAFESEGRVTGLFGASGSGKTSLVNMIAGLLVPDRGRIVIDGETVDDVDKRVHVPAHRRRIGYVFQDARLFPHLDVRQNLDYGRRMNHIEDDPAQLKRITELLDIGNLLDRRPGKLSGGERQRVALGRALLSKPRLLLLDEPLGALDVGRRAEILPYLVRLRDEARIPMVYVSHDAAEMRQLAVDHQQHTFKLMAAAQDQARGRDHAVHALLAREPGIFFDAVDRHFRSAAEHREHRAVFQEVDGVVAPFAVGDHAAVEIEDAVEFEAIERHPIWLRARSSARRHCAILARIGILRYRRHARLLSWNGHDCAKWRPLQVPIPPRLGATNGRIPENLGSRDR